jgi:hypothetical protein
MLDGHSFCHHAACYGQKDDVKEAGVRTATGSQKAYLEQTIDSALVERKSVVVMPALPDTSEGNWDRAIWNVPQGCEARRHRTKGLRLNDDAPRRHFGSQ